MNIKVYGGLSIERRDVAAVLPRAEFAAPIRRGDLTSDIRRGVQVVAIVDGEFNQSLAVSPTEVLDGLRCGLRVYGSSSMGAMRAVELAGHGMLGHGEIFEYIARRPYFADDHLGQLFFRDADFAIATMPLIDLAIALAGLCARELVAPPVAEALERAYRRMHYSQRSLELLRAQFHDDDAAVGAIGRLEARTMSAKRSDALGLLRRIKDDLAEIRRLNRRLLARS